MTPEEDHNISLPLKVFKAISENNKKFITSEFPIQNGDIIKLNTAKIDNNIFSAPIVNPISILVEAQFVEFNTKANEYIISIDIIDRLNSEKLDK